MSDRIWIWFADNGNIRKWSTEPFPEGTEYLACNTEYLLGVIADIRMKSGVGARPMLAELADAIAACIPSPGALDPYTIERCAEVARRGGCTSSGCDVRYGKDAASWHSDLCPVGIATRIRALAKGPDQK